MASVLVPLAQGCEELEAITVVDLLRRAGIDVVTAGLDDRPVRASRGSVLLPDMTLDQALERDYDMVVLPGGLPGADHLDNDERVHDLLKSMAGSGGYTAAICAAPKVLASAGLLDGRRIAHTGLVQCGRCELSALPDPSMLFECVPCRHVAVDACRQAFHLVRHQVEFQRIERTCRGRTPVASFACLALCRPQQLRDLCQ